MKQTSPAVGKFLSFDPIFPGLIGDKRGKTLAQQASMAFYVTSVHRALIALLVLALPKADAMVTQCGRGLEKAVRHSVLLSELGQLSGDELYEQAFRERLMKPHPSRLNEYIGNNQRKLFVPGLRRLVRNLPHGTVLDVGAGSGEIVDLALREMESCQLYVNEPNHRLLDCYQDTLAKYPNIHLAGTFAEPAQKFTEVGSTFIDGLPPIDLVLMIHMLYHLTTEELKDVLAILFDKLPPGGTIFLVYADQENSTSGKAAEYYFENKNRRIAAQIRAAWRWRAEMFREGKILKVLSKRVPGSAAEITSEVTPSRIYADSREDLAVMCHTGELSINEKDPTGKLFSSLQFIHEFGPEIDLKQVRSGVRKGMFSSAQPQVVCQIRRIK